MIFGAALLPCSIHVLVLLSELSPRVLQHRIPPGEATTPHATRQRWDLRREQGCASHRDATYSRDSFTQQEKGCYCPALPNPSPTAHWWSSLTSAGGPRQGWKEFKPTPSPPPRGAAGRYGAVPQAARFTPPPRHQATAGHKNCGFLGALGGSVVRVSADRHGHPGTAGCSGAQRCPGLQRAGIRHPPKAPTAAAPSSAARGDYSRAPTALLSTAPPERKIKKKKRGKKGRSNWNNCP